jgi:hypothetical protein
MRARKTRIFAKQIGSSVAGRLAVEQLHAV